MKIIHRYVIRYAISLYLHQSHFKNKSKCEIAVTCHLFCKKKRTSWSFDCCLLFQWLHRIKFDFKLHNQIKTKFTF